jgi:hypothetical protein
MSHERPTTAAPLGPRSWLRLSPAAVLLPLLALLFFADLVWRA